jgi:hypothetical protein
MPPRLRPLLGGDLDAVDAAALERLIGASEDGDLDFKVALPSMSEGDVKETAYDVAQFANAAGGLLVLGVDEDGEGRATTIVGIDPPGRDFGLWLHQVVASRVTPNATVVHRSVDVGGGKSVHIVSVAPSVLAPHGVQVGDFALRYPLRVGNTRRWLSEGEIADRYRARFTALAERDHLTDRLHESAVSRFAQPMASNEQGAETAWLLVACVPDSPGRLELRRDTTGRWLEWLAPAMRQFPSQLRRDVADVQVGFRSLEVTDSQARQPPFYDLGGVLNLDGSGFLALLHPGGVGSRGVPSDTCAVFDEHLIADLLNGLATLAEHAVRTGAIGDATISAQLRSAHRELVIAQYRKTLGPATLHGSRQAGVASGLTRHTVPLELLVAHGRDRLVGARVLAADLWSAFGLAEPQQITEQLELVHDRFANDISRPVEEWAAARTVPIVPHLPS